MWPAQYKVQVLVGDLMVTLSEVEYIQLRKESVWTDTGLVSDALMKRDGLTLFTGEGAVLSEYDYCHLTGLCD